jgi:Na+/phosphate symporter
MYKDLLTIFKKDSLLDMAFARTYEMIDITSKMYEEVRIRLRKDAKYKFSFDIRDQDIAVNKYEREIRRKVFNHLCVSGVENLNSGLILISIIIDIERIGDYTKNMVDLAETLDKCLNGGKFEKDLNKIEKAVRDSFKRMRPILEEGNEADAAALISDYAWVNKLCDQHVNDFLNEKDDTINAGESVALTLYYRYLKRINSHLRNIASSVVNPFHKIGFFKNL